LQDPAFALIPHASERPQDVSISYGEMLNHALTAAGSLAKEGVSAEVIDLRTIAPYDKSAVFTSVSKTGRQDAR
jgi:pyruvate/2-oxoglutarate/acetoin dehydrogenase E1 component